MTNFVLLNPKRKPKPQPRDHFEKILSERNALFERAPELTLEECLTCLDLDRAIHLTSLSDGDRTFYGGDAKNTGKVLLRLKQVAPRGHFQKLVTQHFRGTYRTARRYQQVAIHGFGAWDKIRGVTTQAKLRAAAQRFDREFERLIRDFYGALKDETLIERQDTLAQFLIDRVHPVLEATGFMERLKESDPE